jgi:ubiquinone/menaquinone biosynthesis C-methylase UbiE
MLNGMNPGHAKLADWGFTHLPELAPDRAIDIGCGGGRNAGELLRMYPKGHVTAIDYSDLSVAKASDYNRDMIAAGRSDVRQGDAASLAFPDASFDLATAFETVYFWPGLEKCFKQVFRVLRSGGVFMICNESDGTDPASKKFESIIDGMKCYTAQELEAALRAAGFAVVESDRHPSKPWLTVVARK